ncbi:MAG: alpha-mannosidase, partial [Chitinivibrionales bacterium]|nr:alpha-mannosidase [Chitinivibrionales bacterium]
LYLEVHRGTYTTQARTKKWNRTCESGLRDSELWCVAATVLEKKKYPHRELNRIWNVILDNQFHDILPGSSIEQVYKETEECCKNAYNRITHLSDSARKGLVSHNANSVTVFNSLSHDRIARVEIPRSWKGAADDHGDLLPVQNDTVKNITEIRVPSCGWTTIRRGPPLALANRVTVTKKNMENEVLKITLNKKGELTGIFDKETRQEIACEECNRFMLYKDVPTWFDAWDLEKNYLLNPVPIHGTASLTVICSGPLMGVLRVEKTINNSQLVQDIVLYRNSRIIEFRTGIDWEETHKVLKVNFPVTVHADHALYEIQFGHIARANHESRDYEEAQFEVCNHKWTALAETNRGVALLNDCKYGVDVRGNSINLTCLRAAKAPDMHADRGHHAFTYALYPWNGSLYHSDFIHRAYELNCPVVSSPGRRPAGSLFTIDAGNVIIETVKMAEDNSGDVIVRMYESKRTATRALLKSSLPVLHAAETDLLENPLSRKAGKVNNGIRLDFRPFEIKTLRLTPKKN